MTNYLFIETREPFESRDTRFVVETAISLSKAGSTVTVFLAQNGVLAARKNASGATLDELASANVTILADDFALCERGIHTPEMHTAVKAANIDALIDALMQENTKAVWH